MITGIHVQHLTYLSGHRLYIGGKSSNDANNGHKLDETITTKTW